MSSSRNEAECVVHIKSQSGPLEIQLLDHQLRPVVSGYGELVAHVPAGLYMLQYSAGQVLKQEYIKVLPDRPYEKLDFYLTFPSAAPVSGSSSAHDYHATMARKLTLHEPRIRYGAGGCLMIFARSTDGDGRAPVKLDRLSLWDGQMRQLSHLGSDARALRHRGLGRVLPAVNPGGYTLRWHALRSSRWSRNSREPLAINQSLWVGKGWITIVFIGHSSHSEELDRQGASIHLARIGTGFKPYSEPRMNQALELALSGLRTGASVVPGDLLELLLHAKFQNPMLGIIGAHALLQSRDTNWSLFQTVVDNLAKPEMISGHPDVIALRLMAKLKRKDESPTDAPPISWPPMLYTAYRGLIARDWQEPNRISEGSVAQLAASRLLSQSPWSCWVASEEPSAGFTTQVRRAESTRSSQWSIRPPIPRASSARPCGDLAAVSYPTTEATPPTQSADLADPAVEQVSRYLAERMQYCEDVDISALSMKQFFEVGLPVASVKRAIEVLVQMAERHSRRSQARGESAGPVTVERSIGGKTISIEFGRLAKQASGAVVVRMGDTMTLVAAVAGPERDGLDFLPLSVDYREKTYAAGKFSGGFIKREGRPTTREILKSRLIDRSIRPLFHQSYRHAVQIQAGPISDDRQNDAGVLSIVGASAALMLARVPWFGPVGAIRLARVDGQFVPFPTVAELEESDLDLIVSSTEKAIVMIEGFGDELPEPEMGNAIMEAHRLNQGLIALQKELIESVGLPPLELSAAPDDALRQTIYDRYGTAPA